jgi:transcriptional regulator with XRE-family HTH domain
MSMGDTLQTDAPDGAKADTLTAAIEADGRSRELIAGLSGCSLSHLRALERGASRPGLDLALSIAQVLDRPVGELWPVRRYEEDEA